MKSFRLAAALLLGGGCAVVARAQADEAGGLAEADRPRYLVGAMLSEGPIYFGQQQRAVGLKPLLAVRWGRWRISNSGAGALLGRTEGGGASTELISRSDWSLRASVRIDRGRRIEDDTQSRLQDLPDVRGTLRGRLALSYRLGSAANLGLVWAPDLLGREGGSTLALAYTRAVEAPAWLQQNLGGRWTVGGDLVRGDATYMRSYFGVPEGALRFPAYRPAGGWRNASLGLGWQRDLDAQRRWVVFAGASGQYLLDEAARAPFVQQRLTWAVQTGVAYRR